MLNFQAVRFGGAVLGLIVLCLFYPLLPSLKAEDGDAWVRTLTVDSDFETISSFLKSSIEEEGLTIANTGSVAEMMARTQDAVEGAPLVFAHGEIYQFCSAKLGARLFALDPSNIGACPLSVFLYQLKGESGRVVLGYRLPPSKMMGPSGPVFEEVRALLERIIKRAAE